MIDRMRVFVTGGSGFVGGRLLDTLARTGHTGVGLARSDRAAAAVEAHGATAVRGDLDDPAALRAGMAGADLVVHAAAKLTGGARERAEYERVNVAGTGAVLDAARATDGEPVVFREFWEAMLDTQGVRPLTGTLPRGAARAIAGATEAAWRVLRLAGEPPLDRMTVALLGDECTVDDGKARRDLGYAGGVSVEAGLAELRAAPVAGG
jgi:nucleoside-diphosphate-sugar epimerase